MGKGSYFAELGNWPISMVENGSISTDFGHKKSDRKGNIVLGGRKTENVSIIIVIDTGNDRS